MNYREVTSHSLDIHEDATRRPYSFVTSHQVRDEASTRAQHYIYYKCGDLALCLLQVFREYFIRYTIGWIVVKYENTSNTCVDLVLTNGVIHYGPGESLLKFNQNKARTTST